MTGGVAEDSQRREKNASVLWGSDPARRAAQTKDRAGGGVAQTADVFSEVFGEIPVTGI